MSYSPRAELSQAVDRQFERAVLPFFQILWPTMTRPKPLGYWDRRGIDLVTNVEKRPIQCCVECKSSADPEINSEQYRKIFTSIGSFRKSKISADTYIVVYNREVRNESQRNKIEIELRDLVSRGQVRVAEFWDINKLFKRIKESLRSHLQTRIADSTAWTLSEIEKMYGPRWAWQYQIPVATQRMRFKRDSIAEYTELSPYSTRHVRDILFGEDKLRWTMVTGQYGVGKTIATLLAAHNTDNLVIRAECRQFDDRHLGGGTNSLTKEIVRSLDLSAPTENCSKQFEYFSGRELSSMLRNPNNQFVLILDGLDENRHYCRYRGLAQLTSQLAEFQCPIVLVTRREHFDARFGDISSTMFDLSLKNGPSREAVVANLGHWGQAELSTFLMEMKNRLGNVQKRSLQKLAEYVRDGKAEDFYGTLLYHPLFLSFIVDDVLNEGIRVIKRVDLIQDWVTRKILRDRASGRIVPVDEVDAGRFVELMMRLLDGIAFKMIDDASSTVELKEKIAEDEILYLATKIMTNVKVDILEILLNSILVTNGVRSTKYPLELSFSHRLLQEYFTARVLFENGRPTHGFSDTIGELFLELKESRVQQRTRIYLPRSGA